MTSSSSSVSDSISSSVIRFRTSSYCSVLSSSDFSSSVSRLIASSVLFKYQRSEEHTSELQSRGHLVCRLLLEKKNILKSNLIPLSIGDGRRLVTSRHG